MTNRFRVWQQLPVPWNQGNHPHEMIQIRRSQLLQQCSFYSAFHGECLLQEETGKYYRYIRRVLFSKWEGVLLKFNPFVKFFNKLTKLLVSFNKIVDCPAGMKNSGMVFISAMQANTGKGRFCMLL